MAKEETEMGDIDPSEIISRFESMLADHDLRREVKIFVKTTRHISTAELDRQFTC